MTWVAGIKAGDVLRCAFPLREQPDRPGPKIRPSLALALSVGNDSVLVAYGTSQAHQTLQDWQVSAILETGIVTVFDLSRRVLLPATAEYFPLASGKRTPVLTTLPDDKLTEIARAIKAANARR